MLNSVEKLVVPAGWKPGRVRLGPRSMSDGSRRGPSLLDVDAEKEMNPEVISPRRGLGRALTASDDGTALSFKMVPVTPIAEM